MMPMISSPHGNKTRAIATNADMGTNASLDGQGIAPGNGHEEFVKLREKQQRPKAPPPQRYYVAAVT
jgi:hypothetical protein